MSKVTKFEHLIGKTFSEIKKVGNPTNELNFTTSDGERFWMGHHQECCEFVYLEDICGNLDDLIGSPLLMAEVVSQGGRKDNESGTWTFYKFATLKGYVTLRWFGTSNGYYSEEVSFKKVERERH